MLNGLKNCGSETTREISSLGKAGIKELVDSVDTFIFDCDGVIWHTSQMLPASSEIISHLRKLGKNIYFITNNSLFSHEDILKKFEKGGIHVPKEDLVFPALLLCDHLRKINFKGTIEILGEPALKNEVRAGGFDVSDSKWTSTFVNGEHEFRTAVLVKEPITAVLVDIDLNGSFVKISRIINLLNNPDCLFFSGATDKKIPIASTLTTPGPEYLLEIIKELTGRTPHVLGKPDPGMFELLRERHSVNPERTIIIGDSLESDIRMAKVCGIRSILVLTGSTKRENIPYDEPEKMPTYIAESLVEILSLMEME